jgi:protein OS-9
VVLILQAVLSSCAERLTIATSQFEVVFSEAYISEPEAQALIETSDPSHPSYDAELTEQTDLTSNMYGTAEGDSVDGSDGYGAAETYEIMNMASKRYLCAIPVIEPPPALNETATELAKAEEARELARASAHGWDLVNGLDGTCLYYMSGWWSYSFCYGHDIVQFHALPGSMKTGPPVRDPQTMEYVLGRVKNPKATSRSQRRDGQSNEEEQTSPAPPNTALQVKGDQRYLVQKMEGGTVCDLTNRDRTIEVQYHCSPGATQDRIGWIKEVTTCAYLMVVHTPRLCADVAFQPPKEARANIISCRTIVPESEQAEWHARKTLEAQAAMVGQAKAAGKGPITIGGVVVGGRQMLKSVEGKEPHVLSPPRGYRSGNAASLVEVVAQGKSKDDGSTITIVTDEQLEKMGISPELVEEIQQELQKMAGDKGWKIEVVDLPGDVKELQGIVEDGEEGEEGEGEDEAGDDSQGGEDREDGEGSQEKFFKEEL